MIDRHDFEIWLKENNPSMSPKLIRDKISRVVGLEKKFKAKFGEDFTLDQQFEKDKGVFLLYLFGAFGRNALAEGFSNDDLPIGTTQIYPLKSALKSYFSYLESK